MEDVLDVYHLELNASVVVAECFLEMTLDNQTGALGDDGGNRVVEALRGLQTTKLHVNSVRHGAVSSSVRYQAPDLVGSDQSKGGNS